ALERRLRLLARPRQQAAVDFEPGETEAGRAGLAGAEHVAFAAQAQILLGDAEAILRRPQRLAPRPTRPRSWCNWASPNRSACSMIMIVASGTSTPTSMTVVATRILVSPRW